MSNIDDALNEVTKVYNIFRGAEKIKETLENVKNFETVEKEVSARIAKLKAEEAKLQERKDDILNESLKKRDQANEVLANAQAQAASIEADAKAKARAIIEAAEEKKDKINSYVEVEEAHLQQLKQDVSIKAAELSNLESTLKETKAGLLKLAGA